MDRFDALKIFCAVVESGSFTKAANKLGISTSSVTNQIEALESHFRVKLLNRTTRSMSLSDEGRRCYERALQLIADMSELEGSLQDSTRTPSGTLHVDLPGIFGRLYLAPAVPEFLAMYPEITLKITARDRYVDMVDEGVDVLLRLGKLHDSGLIAKTIGATEYITCASPEFIHRHGIPATPDDLSNFSCLNFMYPTTRQVRPWMFQDAGSPFTWIPTSHVVMDHVDSLIEAGIAGAGIIQVLSASIREPLNSGELVPLLQPWKTKGPDISVLYHQKQHRSAKVKVFIEFVEGLFRESN